MMMRKYKAMKSFAYHEKQLEYNMTGTMNEIREIYKLDKDTPIDLSDPRYKDILENSAFHPKPMGQLAKTLGLDDKVMTVDLWRDLSHGWVREDILPKNHKLGHLVEETPRGNMVKLTRSSTKINPDGTYHASKKEDKQRRAGSEFLYVFGQNLGTVISKMATEDPSVEKKFKDLCIEVLNNEIMPEILNDAKIRKGKDGKEIQEVKEIIAVPFFHTENRAEMPFYHFHFDLMNVAKGHDDNFYTLCTDVIGQNASKYDAIFMGSMKEKLEKEFGFVFDQVFHKDDVEDEFQKQTDMKVVSFDIPDSVIPDNVKEWRAKRENEIQEEMNKLKLTGKTAKEIARVESRDEKTDLSPTQLRAKWKEAYEEMGWTTSQMNDQLEVARRVASHRKIVDEKPTYEQMEETFLRHHKEVAFTEDQFKSHLIKQMLPHKSFDEAQREAEKYFTENCVRMMDKEKIKDHKDFLDGKITDPHEYQQAQYKYSQSLRFTTKSILEKDTYISSSFKDRVEEKRFMLDKGVVKQSILNFEKEKGYSLAEGQRNAILASTTEQGAVINIAGRAGAGKSTLLNVVKNVYEKNGYQIWGTSTSSTATKQLAEDTGMSEDRCMNSAKLIKRISTGKLQLTNKDILIVDEAGMMDTPSFYALSKAVNQAGAKLILTGEKEQLSSVGYGGNFKHMNENFTTAQVKDINRQKESWQREMVEDFASGRSHKAIKALYDSGNVVINKTNQERLKSLVDDYMNDKALFKDKIIVATSNDDIEQINHQVRERLKKNGTLQGQAVTIKGRDNMDREFQVNDMIVFTKNQKSDDLDQENLNNSSRAKVLGFKSSKAGKVLSMQVEMEDGKKVWIDTNKKQAIKHAYGVTVHKSQGQTKTNAYYFPSASTNSLNLAYVACSRHKERVKMYLSNDMVDTIIDGMGDKQPTASMVKVAEWISKYKKVELPENYKESFLATREFLDDNHYKMAKKPRNPLDDFISVVESMSKAQFKKTTHDYQILDGKQTNTEEAKLMAQADREMKLEKAKQQINQVGIKI